MKSGHSRVALVAAFGAVYFIWGSTYLAIRLAIETMPPFLMAGSRFVVAGAALYAWVRWRGGVPRPGRGDWRSATVIGGLLLLGGNGGVVWAEQHIPSGLAALLVATVPLFMVLLEWTWNGGDRPSPGTVGGLLMGFGGVLLLVGAPSGAPAGRGLLAGGVLLLAALSWATGSIYARRIPVPSSPGLGTAMQMLAGGALLLGVGVAVGEPLELSLSTISARSWLALAYLIVFGSLIAFSAYVWLLRTSTPARVSTYAYVNPAVALFLGWALAGEPISGRTLLGSAVILTAVMIVTTRGRRGGRPAARPPRVVVARAGGGVR